MSFRGMYIKWQLTSQTAQAHYMWVRASEVIWSEYTLVHYLMVNKRKNLKDMKSSCLSICTSSL